MKLMSNELELAREAGQRLMAAGLTLATAESCTGGLIGHWITEIAGSSAYYLGGIVAYSNEVKRSHLGVADQTLMTHGAVSDPTAREMARGARLTIGAHVGVATTGIAGPGGGSEEKPVGTVCIALAWDGGVWSKRWDLGLRERGWVKQMTAQLALDRLRRHLLAEPAGAGGRDG
jgi:PncC family amidohydrolase